MGIIILGPKHSGKTSAGRALAKLLSCAPAAGEGEAAEHVGKARPPLSTEPRFIDLDELIAARSGKSPRALYREGPEIFQNAEAEALASLVEEAGACPGLIIAAGGGISDNERAAVLIKETNTLIPVYLEISAAAAWKRISGSARREGELPPFLQTGSPEETHRSLHERRGAACKKLARIIIAAEEKSPEEIAAEIARACGLWDAMCAV
jgi:shikimate kinase